MEKVRPQWRHEIVRSVVKAKRSSSVQMVDKEFDLPFAITATPANPLIYGRSPRIAVGKASDERSKIAV